MKQVNFLTPKAAFDLASLQVTYDGDINVAAAALGTAMMAVLDGREDFIAGSAARTYKEPDDDSLYARHLGVTPEEFRRVAEAVAASYDRERDPAAASQGAAANKAFLELPRQGSGIHISTNIYRTKMPDDAGPESEDAYYYQGHAEPTADGHGWRAYTACYRNDGTPVYALFRDRDGNRKGNLDDSCTMSEQTALATIRLMESHMLDSRRLERASSASRKADAASPKQQQADRPSNPAMG